LAKHQANPKAGKNWDEVKVDLQAKYK